VEIVADSVVRTKSTWAFRVIASCPLCYKPFLLEAE
jgi:hypothetical protein